MLDPVGGTAPVISAAMFNLQSDQSRGTPRKRTPAARLEHSAGSFISFCILSRSTARARERDRERERSNEAEGEFAKQNCAQTPSSVPVRSYPTGLTCLFVNHAIQMTTGLRVRGLRPFRNATSQSFAGYAACVRLQRRAPKHRCSFNGAVEQTVCVKTPDGQFPPRLKPVFGAMTQKEAKFPLKSGFQRVKVSKKVGLQVFPSTFRAQ